MENKVNSWSVKNDRRKKCKQEGKHKFQQGRVNRKALATGGAFGDLAPALYNLCAMGTTSGDKQIKKTKETYDSGSDYDQ